MSVLINWIRPRVLGGVGVLICLFVAGDAWAQDKKASKASTTICSVDDERVEIIGKSGTVVVPVHSDVWTRLFVPEGTDVKGKRNPPGFKFEYDRAERVVDMKALADADVGDEMSIKAFAPRYEATIILRVVALPSQGCGSYRLAHVSARAARASKDKQFKRKIAEAKKAARAARAKAAAANQIATNARREAVQARREADRRVAMIEAKAKRTIDEVNTAAEKRIKDIEQQHVKRAAERLVRHEERRLEPDPKDAIVTQGPLRTRYWDGSWEQEYFLFPIDLQNSNSRPFQLADAQMLDADGKPLPSRIAWPAFAEEPANGVYVTISHDERVRIVVAVKLGTKEVPDGLQLALSEPTGKDEYIQRVPRYRFRPISEEEYQEEVRQKRREKLGKQTIVSVRALYGAFWIADGLGQNQLDVTDFKGLGVRYTKGLHENWGIEAALAFGTTGQAFFTEMMIGGNDGDLTRDAMLGRVGFGGVFRFGDKYQPHMRLGVAGQVARFGETFSGEGDTGGGDSSFEFSLLLTASGGVDVRFGDNLIVGATLSAETPLGSAEEKFFRNAASFGGHVAWGW